ncbi:VWA domain-containing protein [Neptunomonas phycophila]|uniref:VWA domain-containing protein n=1 Tax=Neptunomonas phycophila TaxID=1572645 RepID=A0ABT9EZD2_9GAMM|nr:MULTISPECIES: VWA domain-containing protein [Neptunomonas]MDN2661596.1 VWA domain-containing protein [Neptunomonas sp. CHC150]MDP2524396.1 VWA domain-containing protein [Neptunomonas phycophila]
MLIDFFYTLRKAEVPVTVKELLTLLEALKSGVVFASIDDFYLLSRLCLVKDEKYFDRFDQAFGFYFKGLDDLKIFPDDAIPSDWLRSEFFKDLSAEEKAAIEKLGGLDKLLNTLNERLKDQHERHAGGNKWIGTGGTSPFGHSGYNPEGIRIGGESRHKRAVKVWEKREFKNLDDSVELGTRNLKVALRKLRQFARTGSADELDLKGTIKSTAENAGLLDIKMVPERHNAAKVLLFLDIGGSMDPYIHLCEQLFSAARSEFKHLEYFYFHNCVYEHVWKDNRRRFDNKLSTLDVLNTYGSDYRVIFIGDAAMSPYELLSPYGSVEHMNEETGQVWLQRIIDTWGKAIWLNPVDAGYWKYTQTTDMISKQLAGHMYPLTLEGLENAIKYLSK